MGENSTTQSGNDRDREREKERDRERDRDKDREKERRSVVTCMRQHFIDQISIIFHNTSINGMKC